jgi:uncharacterized protein YjbI with pentapeptide repeats
VLESKSPDIEPESKRPAIEARLRLNLDEASKNARGVFYLYLGFSLYCFLTASTTSDRQLLIPGEKIHLPIVDVQLPLRDFFLAAPLLLLAVFIYLQLYLHVIKKIKLKLYEITGSKIETGDVFPWMISIIDSRGSDFKRELVEWLQHFVVMLLLWCNLPFVLGTFVGIFQRSPDSLSVMLRYASIICPIIIILFWLIYEKPKTWYKITSIIFFPIILWLVPLLLFSRTPLDLSYQKISPDEVAGIGNTPLIYLKGINLQRSVLVSTVLNRADLRNANLKNSNMTQANLEAAWLDSALLNRANLSGANLSKSSLLGASLDGATLTGASLKQARFSPGTILKGVKLDNANLTGAYMDSLVFDCISLSGATIDSSSLASAKFIKGSYTGLRMIASNLNKANLDSLNLAGVVMMSCKLRDAHLRGAVINAAIVRYSTFMNADLEGADLAYTDLTKCDLLSANLSNANLRSAFLDSTDMTLANLAGADLRDAFLRGTKGLDIVTLREAKCLEGAEFDKALKTAIRNDKQCSALLNCPK